MKLGEAIAYQLASRGVTDVFGIPGVHTIEMYRGLPAAGIASHPARHEQGTGFMADAYARQTGRPGVALLVTGPGLLNALTPLAQAWHDSVPVLLIAADTATADLGRGRGPLHDVRDQALAARGVTEHSWRLTDPVDLPGMLDAAWAAMTAPRPRPVVLSIPIDLLSAEVSDALAAVPAARLPERAVPSEAEVANAAAVIDGAARPVLIAGGGARGAAPRIRALAERLDAPVVTTGNGAGVLPPAHGLNVGPLLPFAGAHELIASADVVIAVGTEFSDADVIYSGRRVEIGGALVRIDADPANLHAPFPADAAILADAAEAAGALAAAVAVRPASDGARRALAARDGSDWTDQSLRHMPWVEAIRRAVPADAVTALDSTQLAYTLHQAVTPSEPTARLAPYGLGTLGPALPMGIGAAIAEPDRPVLVIMGDGGGLFTLAELATAVDLGRQFTVLVWDNQGYAEIRDSFDRARAERIDIDVTARDHAQIARGFGAEAVTVRTPEELERALGEAMAADHATVVVARGF